MRNSSLEWLRGLAAVYVFTSHFKDIHGAAVLSDALAFLRFGPEMVMLFFLLSGTVIRLSVAQHPPSRGQFLRRRGVRLLPLYWFALGMAVALEWYHGEPCPWDRFLGHLLFCQTQEGFITTVVRANDPLWSLSFEAFFYLCFTLLLGRWQTVGMRLWCVLAGLAVLVQWRMPSEGIVGHFILMFAYSSLWLVGYYLPALAQRWQVSWSTGLAWAALVPIAARLDTMERWQYHWAALHFVVGLCLIPLLLHCLPGPSRRRTLPWYSLVVPYAVFVSLAWSTGTSAWGPRVIYTALPLLALGTGAVMQYWWVTPLTRWPTLAQWLGKNSYALYVLHAPCIYWANHVAPTFSIRLLWVLLLVPSVTLFGEYVVHPWVARLLMRSTPSARRPTEPLVYPVGR